jgi:hypothetical protein
MLASSDIIPIPYTPDLTEAGITYACRSLAYTYDRMGGSSFDRLRRIVAGVAVELALRRYLGEQAVPFDVLGATPFTDPDHYDLALGGHRCDVKSFLITHKKQILQLRKDPALLLHAPALVPLDQAAAEGHASRDLYLFAFLLALTAPSRDDLRRALAAGQPIYLIHPLPAAWSRPAAWVPLDGLALKSECRAPLTVELGGQEAGREFVTLRLELPPKRRVAVEQTFYSLAYIRAGRIPEVRVGLHSPARGDPYLIPPQEWGNIWVYGLSILLAGYLTYEEFRHKAQLLPVGSAVFQYARTRTKNLSMPVAELHPLGELFERLRAAA